MQQVAQPTDQPLLTDEEQEKMMELLLVRSQKLGHSGNGNAKPPLTQEMVSEAMMEVLQARYEKKFQQMERHFVRPMELAIERRQQEPPEMTLAWWRSLGSPGVEKALGISFLLAALVAVASWFL